MVRRLLALFATIGLLPLLAGVADVHAATYPSSSVVSAVPAAATPAVNDGAVKAIAKVGDTMIIGGTFSAVTSPGATAPESRGYIAAFDLSTGAVSSAFAPVLDGPVTGLQPAGDGRSVFAVGAFTHLNGRRASHVVRLDLQSGRSMPGFRADPTDGVVNTVATRRGRVFIGGFFSSVAGRPHAGIAALDSGTGALVPYMGVQLTGEHSTLVGGVRGHSGVHALDVSPDGTRLVAVGNFIKADGLPRVQIVMIDLGQRASVATHWATTRYLPQCSPNFDSYMRDVAFSPDGSYFVVAATGGRRAGSLCDAAARWQTHAIGTSLDPVWVDNTGSDTLLSVAVTGSAVYVGGHQRWMNNPLSGRAGPGAVPRPGLAALRPDNGVPLAWNPGRNPRGGGTFALLATSNGLWVGSDTGWIGNRDYLRPRIAFFPAAGGRALPAEHLGSLPGSVYQLGPTASGADPASARSIDFTGTAASAVAPVDLGASWQGLRGAFMVDKTLFYGWSNGNLYRRPWYGNGLGPSTRIDPYHDPAWSNVQTGVAGDQTYVGAYPDFYGQIRSITGMFYRSGRLYYTLAGNSALFWRDFSLDSGIISPLQHRATTAIDWRDSAGMFLASDTLYYASAATGALSKVTFSAAGTQGPSSVLRDPSLDGLNWAAHGLVLFAGSAQGTNSPPVASLTQDCSGVQCRFAATGSSDPDGRIVAYDWSFGDGSTGTGAPVDHAYAGGGDFTVTLTVTDDEGATASTSATVHLIAANSVSFVAANDAAGGGGTAASTVPAGTSDGDTLLVAVSAADVPSLPSPGPGWSQVTTVNARSLTTTVWSKQAAAGDPADDAGARLTVPLGAAHRWTMSVLDYSGVAATAAVATATDLQVTARHTTPGLAISSGARVLTLWSDKSSSTTAWSAPTTVVPRANPIGTGGGRITSLVADSGGPYAESSYPERVARTDVAAPLATMVTLALSPRS